GTVWIESMGAFRNYRISANAPPLKTGETMYGVFRTSDMSHRSAWRAGVRLSLLAALSAMLLAVGPAVVAEAASGTVADDMFAPDDWAQRLEAFAKRQHGASMGSRDFTYRLTDESVIDDMPADGRARGATSGMGIELTGSGDPFGKAFVVYMRFKD